MFSSGMNKRQKERADRVEAGLCADCGKNPFAPESGRLCIHCLDISRKAVKKHAIKLKSQKQDLINKGLCTKCTKRPICIDRSGILCVVCLDRSASSSKKAAVKRKRKRLEKKECVKCGLKLPKNNLGQCCDRCKVKISNSKSNWVLKIKEKGLCRDCGGEKEDQDKAKCNNCLKKDTIRTINRQNALTELGLCNRCGKNEIHKTSKLLCVTCLEVSSIKIKSKKQGFLLDGLCYTCGNEKEDDSSICNACKKDLLVKHNKLRARVLFKYGSSCECCDYKHINFLTIDHINNDGNQERDLYGSGSSFYVYLDKEPVSKTKYQILCFNCNVGKARNNNICPHFGITTDTDSAHYRRKKLILNNYGEVCNCCSEENIIFLTIDHIKGGGTKHRKTLTSNFYSWLIKENYPKGFQTLCQNCNWSKYLNGTCVHKSAPIFDLVDI